MRELVATRWEVLPLRNAKAQLIADGAGAYAGAGAGGVPLQSAESPNVSNRSSAIRCAGLQRSPRLTPIVTRS